MKNNPIARSLPILAALVVIWGFFALVSPGFLSPRNISMLIIELSCTAILALGMLLVLLPSQIDLSAGSGVGLFGGLAAVLVFQYHWPAFAALLLSLIAAIIIWNLLGRLIIREKVPAFIVTLGGLLVFKGLHWLVIRNATVPVVKGGQSNLYSILTTYYIPPTVGYVLAGLVVAVMAVAQYRAFMHRKETGGADDAELMFLKTMVTGQLLFLAVVACNEYRGVPLSAAILGAVALIVYAITTHFTFGRYLYAIGGNEEASFISGISVDKVVIAAFTIMGAIVALTGFLQTAYAGASTSTIGSLMELDAIAACVIGGTSLRGGRGTVVGVLLGALIMASLLNGMTLMAVSPEIKFIARGLVLMLAVWMDVRMNRQFTNQQRSATLGGTQYP